VSIFFSIVVAAIGIAVFIVTGNSSLAALAVGIILGYSWQVALENSKQDCADCPLAMPGKTEEPDRP
jgi:hypothetical protein